MCWQFCNRAYVLCISYDTSMSIDFAEQLIEIYINNKMIFNEYWCSITQHKFKSIAQDLCVCFGYLNLNWKCDWMTELWGSVTFFYLNYLSLFTFIYLKLPYSQILSVDWIMTELHSMFSIKYMYLAMKF